MQARGETRGRHESKAWRPLAAGRLDVSQFRSRGLAESVRQNRFGKKSGRQSVKKPIWHPVKKEVWESVRQVLWQSPHIFGIQVWRPLQPLDLTGIDRQPGAINTIHIVTIGSHEALVMRLDGATR